MANVIPIQTIIAKRALPLLDNKLPMVSRVNRQYQGDIADPQKRNGGIINLVKPPRFMGRSGELAQTESVVMPAISTNLVMFGVDISISQLDLQLSYDAVANGMWDSTLDSMTSAIAGKIETDGLGLFRGVANSVGTPGTASNDPGILATAGALITSNGGSTAGTRTALLDSFQDAAFATGVKNYFNPTQVVNKAYADGRLGSGYGFEIYDEPAVQTFTSGTYGGTPIIVSASGNTVVTSGWSAGATLNIGDTFKIANVYGFNPQTKQATAAQKFFVVAAAALADGSGNMTITIGEDGIQTSGTLQSVAQAPVAGAAVTVTSGASNTASRQSLAFDKNAIVFASVPTAKVPAGLGAKSTTVKSDLTDISMTLTEWYDGKTNQRMARLDVLYAWLLAYPQLAARIQG